jgi:hypothetical protein
MLHRFFTVLGILAVLLAGVFPAATAQAASPYALYSAAEVAGTTHSLTMRPGATAKVTAYFKNVGQAAWRNSGANYVSIYTYEPTTLKYRASPFRDASWKGQNQAVVMNETTVAPGKTGSFTFTLRAPAKAGTYRETFRAAAENLIWMPGGRLNIDVTVKGEPVAPAPVAAQPTPTPTPATPVVSSGTTVAQSAADLRAALLLISDRSLSLSAGASKQIRVGFKNAGTSAWQKAGARPLVLRLASGTADALKNPTWNGNVAASLPSDEVKPGQLVFFDVNLVAAAAGTYTPRFELVAGGEPVEGGSFELPVTVTQGSASAASATEHLYVSDFAGVGPRGPNVRVGLFYTTDPVVIAAPGAYTMYDSSGASVKKLSGVTTVVFDLAGKTYYVSNSGFSYVSSLYPRFIPDDPAATIFQVTSYESRPTWDTSLNFNQFRGSLEVRYAATTGRLWVIEELPMEDYMRGLAETSNASHYEYQKALVTAARTYANYVLYIGGKHISEGFNLLTDGNDQVYKGYVSELVRPNVVRAVEETRGLVVSYNSELVVTPYFSRSDGRTRSWSEVWNGSKPWLITKPAPYDAREGFALWGHGVGMSAMDAYYRAGDGWAWQDILKYYYTGIDIRRLY